ncbi:MAG: hypothetical protein ACI92I_000144 [Acidimicrobiales bacterium]|jgi:hypothetical protein
MEQENQNSQEPVVTPNEMKMPEEAFGGSSITTEEPTTHLGIILGVLIVLLILILSGLYLWTTTLTSEAPIVNTPVVERPTAEENNEPESTKAEAEVETLQAVSTSDEIDAIEADIESTNFDELDAEMEAITAELDAALEEF